MCSPRNIFDLFTKTPSTRIASPLSSSKKDISLGIESIALNTTPTLSSQTHANT